MHSLNGHYQLLLPTNGTHNHRTLDHVALYTPLNVISKSICSDTLNLQLPAPLLPRTLRCYINAVLLLLPAHYYYITIALESRHTAVPAILHTDEYTHWFNSVTDWYEMKVLTYASTLTETVPAKICRKAMHKK